MKLRVLALSLLLLLSVIYAAGQDNNPFNLHTGHFGRDRDGQTAVVSGSVRTVDLRPIRNARVEVRAIGTGETVASGYTLPNGSFEFTNLPQGMYEIVATLGVQETHERVDLHGAEASVNLHLANDRSDAADGGNAATVSVTQLKVPEKARKLFAKADDLFRKQKFPEARQQADKALQVFPAYAQALTLRGLLKMQDNNIDDACSDLQQAIKSDYNYSLAYVALGAAYNLTNHYDDAARALEHGIVLNPASWQAYFELSKALLGKAQFEAALRQVNKAADLAPPNYPAIHLVRAHALLGVKNYHQAMTELEQFVSSDPNGPGSAHARETMSQVRAFMASQGK